MELRVIAKTYLDKQGRKVKGFVYNCPGKEWVNSFTKRHKSLLSHRVARNITHGRAEINQKVVNDFFDNFEKESEGVPDTIFGITMKPAWWTTQAQLKFW